MEVFNEAEEFLKHQITSNKELNENIEQLEKQIVTDKEEQKKLAENVEMLESEVEFKIILYNLFFSFFETFFRKI